MFSAEHVNSIGLGPLFFLLFSRVVYRRCGVFFSAWCFPCVGNCVLPGYVVL